MYQKYLIVASKKDKAGMNIINQLAQFPGGNFNFYLVDGDMTKTENIDEDKINKFDFIIFASRHESEKKEKTLSVHSPGNWRSAELGGEREKICPASAIFNKELFERLKQNADASGLGEKYKVTLEATHHGPLIEKPCVFIEVGSTQTEWEDRRAGFIIAKTINETIKEFKSNPYREIAIAIGGPHYCPSFNKIQLESNIAIAHVIPNYSFPVTEEMLREAVDKTEEEIDFALLDWKGLGKAEQRDELIKMLDKLYLSYKKTGDVGK